LAIHYRCIINQEKIENSPTGQTIRIKDYASEVMEGYSHTVRIIRNRSSKLKKSVSAHARGILPRQLIRHTMHYSLLLLKMNHPSIFTARPANAVDVFLEGAMPPYTGNIAAFEKEELKKYS